MSKTKFTEDLYDVLKCCLTDTAIFYHSYQALLGDTLSEVCHGPHFLQASVLNDETSLAILKPVGVSPTS